MQLKLFELKGYLSGWSNDITLIFMPNKAIVRDSQYNYYYYNESVDLHMYS